MTEFLTDPGHIRRDLQTIHTALVKKWDLPDALLTKLPMVMAQIAIKGKKATLDGQQALQEAV